MLIILLLTFPLFLGIALILGRKKGEKVANALIKQADHEAEQLRHQAEVETLNQQRELTEARHTQERELAVAAERLKLREKQLAEQLEAIKKRENSVGNWEAELSRIAQLTPEEARAKLMQQVEEEAAHQLADRLADTKAHADREAARILATAINRLAVPSVSEATVTTIPLPSDEMKGRIIGREGRNIRTFENLTGVNVLIDDTPSTVVLSGMDPIRKHIAKHALTDLIIDGRIHPTRIEEAVRRAEEGVEQEVLAAGERAAFKAGVTGLAPELIRHLGLLNFRFSYGQNVLGHSLEVSALLGMMCAELGIDEELGRRIGLLHDIGKAVTHERGRTHAKAGADLARRHKENEAVVNGIACHHNEVEPITVEGSLCGAADALSAGRPGARLEAVDSYIQRTKKLEQLALDCSGVERAYALQAGRELRVIVEPSQVDDSGATALARHLAKTIEQTLTYPGKIRITVMRDKQATSYAY